MKRILVLGAGGMAGHVVSLGLKESGYDIDTLSARNQLDGDTILVDITNQDAFNEVLSKKEYDVIINCVGILIEQSDKRKDLSAYLNAYLPHYLEYRFKETSTKIIHLSTDCVFSGDNAPYREDSPFDGQTFYDRSKALGEINNSKDLTLRMSIIGPDSQESGVGLFNWFYKQTGEIGGYTHAYWNGITTIELMRGIKAALEQNITGLYHLVPDGNISKYDLLGLFKDTFSRDDIIIAPNDKVSLDKTLINTRGDFNFSIQSYPTMVEDMKRWIETHKDLYPHYARKGGE